MNSKILQPFLNKIKSVAPDFYKFHNQGKDVSDLAEMFVPLSEIPYFAGRGFLSQFKGAAGKKNLLQGLQIGGGLAGASTGLDYLGDSELNNKGLSTVLGLLGAVSPSAIRGGRAGLSESKALFDIIRNTAHKGLKTFSGEDAQNKKNILNKIYLDPESIVNKPLTGIKNIIFDKNNRSDFLSLFKPSKGVNIGMLTNRYGGMSDIMPALKQLNSRFGKTDFDTGMIINPNIAAMVESGTLAKLLGKIGYARLHGGATGATKEVGKELQKLLNDRLEKFVYPNILPRNIEPETLSSTKIKKFLPKQESIFPFYFTTNSGLKIKMPRGRKIRSVREESIADMELLLPSLDWNKLNSAQRKWFKSQNINSAKEYGKLVNTVKGMQFDALDAATDPNIFLKQYKKQRLENIFKNESYPTFDFDLKAVAPGLATP